MNRNLCHGSLGAGTMKGKISSIVLTGRAMHPLPHDHRDGGCGLAMAALLAAMPTRMTSLSTTRRSSAARPAPKCRRKPWGKTTSIASSEWATQMNEPRQTMSDLTRAQATAEYLSARREVSALNAEDSGSFYFASLPRRSGRQRHHGQ